MQQVASFGGGELFVTVACCGQYGERARLAGALALELLTLTRERENWSFRATQIRSRNTQVLVVAFLLLLRPLVKVCQFDVMQL